MSWLNCLSRKSLDFDDVKVLDYSRSALTEVPSTVFNFERTLDSLHLDGNKICDLPRTLFQCEELRYLNLGDNEIQVLPPLIIKLLNLQHLDLSHLKCSNIPSNIHKCQKLTVLNLSSNNLEKVPECITSLVSLKELYLNDTSIEFLPATIGRLNNLHILEVRDNMLSMLPKSLKRVTYLQRLDLSNNDFCEMPEVMQYLTNLTELWISGNCMKSVPPEIGSLEKILHFDGSNNEIESIPREISKWSKLTYLSLSENLLSEIPDEICNLRQLETLKLDHNHIQQLPEGIGNLKNLEDLDVRFNNLKSLPNSIGMLRKLNCFIGSNNFISSLPPEIGSCLGLRIFNLDMNLITELPQEIGHLQNLVSVSLMKNHLLRLPITVLKLSKLRALWLSENQNHPLISLQKERNSSDQVFLTCIFLPQAASSSAINETSMFSSLNRRKICFTEPEPTKEFSPHLTRAPTPYPKDYQRYRKSVANILKKQKQTDHLNVKNFNVPLVKEAVVASARPTEDSNLMKTNYSQIYLEKKITENYKQGRNTDVEDSGIEDKVNKSETPSIERDTIHDNPAYKLKDFYSDKLYGNSSVMSLEKSKGYVFNVNVNDNFPKECSNLTNESSEYEVVNFVSENVNSVHYPLLTEKPTAELHSPKSKNSQYQDRDNFFKSLKPPPYHVAAAYSKNAHLFNDNVRKQNSVEINQTFEDKPKHFTQDQPTNIIMPQPKRPLQISLEKQNSSGLDSKHNKNVINNSCEDLLDNVNVKNKCDIACEEKKKIKAAYDYIKTNNQLQGWIFGKHCNRKIVECWVLPTKELGFQFAATTEGLFITSVVDSHSKGSMKVGDKILMIDDVDIMMHSVNSAAEYLNKAGSSAEKFLVSRE